MIVVVGLPSWRAVEPAGPAGRACEIALAAAARGARVELVGRTGDDAAGDALLVALSQAGVGHVSMLRDPVRSTPVFVPPATDEDAAEALVGGGPDARPGDAAPGEGSTGEGAAPRLEPADVSLGLDYLTSFSVAVVTDDVPPVVVPVVAEAAAFAGAHLVVVVAPGGGTDAALLPDATVLEAPSEADEGAFAAVVGAYAAAVDGGESPAAAFADATGDTGWEPFED